MKKILLFIAIILLLVVTVFLITARRTSHEDTTYLTQTDEMLSYEQKTLHEEGETITIDIEYPFIKGIKNASSINTAIEEFIETTIQNFKNQNSNLPLFEDIKSNLGIEYNWREPRHDILSIPFLVYEYTSGAAHPNSYYITLNFNTKTGDQITLQDLFPQNQDYLQELSTLSRDRIREFEKTLEYPLEQQWVLAGTEPKEENFQVFIVERDNLKIIFNPYQIAAYVLGPIEIEIPFDSFTSITLSN